MYAADHDKLFGATEATVRARPRLAEIDYDALMALGRIERARQFAHMFDAAVAAAKRLFH